MQSILLACHFQVEWYSSRQGWRKNFFFTRHCGEWIFKSTRQTKHQLATLAKTRLPTWRLCDPALNVIVEFWTFLSDFYTILFNCGLYLWCCGVVVYPHQFLVEIPPAPCPFSLFRHPVSRPFVKKRQVDLWPLNKLPPTLLFTTHHTCHRI